MTNNPIKNAKRLEEIQKKKIYIYIVSKHMKFLNIIRYERNAK